MSQNEKAFPRQNHFWVGTVNAGTNQTLAVWKPSFAGEVVAFYASSTVAINSNTTNYATVALYDSTSAVTMASVTNNGTTISAATMTAGTLSTTVANKKFAAGDNLEITKVDTSSGSTLTNGYVAVEWVEGSYDA